MSNTMTSTASISIDAPVPEVWDALVSPEKIKKYFHGTQAVSDWKEGSTLEFSGEWKGKPYTDKGIIRKYQENDLLQYTWLSSSSGLEDKPENYALITWQMVSEAGKTILTVSQDNIKTAEAKKQSDNNWTVMLSEIKKIVEGQHVIN